MNSTKAMILNAISQIPNLGNVTQVEGAGQSYAFSAYDEVLKRETFVKVYWYSEDYRDSLLLEPRTLTTLYQSSEQAKHHIVGLYSAEKLKIGEDDYIILRMEFCSGQSLQQKIGPYGLSVHDAIDIGKQICEGVHYLHSVRIAHRDIKPGNVMVEGENCKIVDLGSSIRLDDVSLSARITSAKTLHYSPYEVFPPKRIYYQCSDVYQIGVVLYEMLNGRFCKELPIRNSVRRKCEKKLGKKSASFDGYEMSIMQDENMKFLSERGVLMKELSSLKNFLPLNLARLLNRATHWDAAARYESCTALRADLSKLRVPNWQQTGETEWIVKDWNGKDFKAEAAHGRRGERFSLYSSSTGMNNYRQIRSIASLPEAVIHINGQ